MTKIEDKLNNYCSETEYKPFFSAIFNEKTIAQASIMQSLYTSFGMSIYEQMAVILARGAGYQVSRQYVLLGSIDQETETLILGLCDDSIRNPDKNTDIEKVRQSIKAGPPKKDNESIVDVFIKDNDNTEVYVDITTVKPNIKEFRALRRKMLRWCALRFSQNPDVKIETYIGIPYNPYHPNSYDRFPHCYDPEGDILVQNELWQRFAGYDVFNELLEICCSVGVTMRGSIDSFFDK